MDPTSTEGGFALLSSLADPTRRHLYLYVAARPDGVGRVEAAQEAGISRALAAFHLDRLIAEGLLVADYRRLTGRTGPGAGRPAKIYRRSEAEVSVSVPRRNHELLARLFAEAFSLDGEAGASLQAAARSLGRAIGEQARRRVDEQDAGEPAQPLQAVAAVLEAEGFVPSVDDEGRLVLCNCPFSPIAREYADLVCNANLAMIEGVASGLQVGGVRAQLQPPAGGCCVMLIAECSSPPE